MSLAGPGPLPVLRAGRPEQRAGKLRQGSVTTTGAVGLPWLGFRKKCDTCQPKSAGVAPSAAQLDIGRVSLTQPELAGRLMDGPR